MRHVRRLLVPQVVIDLCYVLLLMTEVFLVSSSDGYFYGRPKYLQGSMQQRNGWSSQGYPVAPAHFDWVPRYQTVPNKQWMRMDGIPSPNSLYASTYDRPRYYGNPSGDGSSIYGYSYGSPWQNSVQRRMQQRPLTDYGYAGGYFFPYAGYGYGPSPGMSWKGYGNRRQDSMMNGYSTTTTTTTTTPRPSRPRKSKLFVANVWG